LCKTALLYPFLFSRESEREIKKRKKAQHLPLIQQNLFWLEIHKNNDHNNGYHLCCQPPSTQTNGITVVQQHHASGCRFGNIKGSGTKHNGIKNSPSFPTFFLIHVALYGLDWMQHRSMETFVVCLQAGPSPAENIQDPQNDVTMFGIRKACVEERRWLI
jgi:hypothetical protein